MEEARVEDKVERIWRNLPCSIEEVGCDNFTLSSCDYRSGLMTKTRLIWRQVFMLIFSTEARCAQPRHP